MRLFFLIALLTSAIPARAADDAEFFEKRIRPVLAEHCYECHGEKKQKGGLRLDSRAAALAGGDLGPSVVPGDVTKSLLIEAVLYENEDLQMPPKKQLSIAQIDDLTEWVKRGAFWPGEVVDATAKKDDGVMAFTEVHTSHWAFQPIRKPVVPSADKKKHPIDAFIEEKLTGAGLAPSALADAHTLLRRLSFDLTGLPPTQEETAVFLSDWADSSDKSDAVKKLVERLLQSPHHGERYARHWLDIARYADSNGSEVDHAMSNAWRYRDYVVKAFNDDKPYDQFVREQVAGDLLPDADADAITATGFLMLGPKALADLDKPKLAADIIDEQVDTVGRAFIALTMGCARCHDHKFDPIGDEDYYAMAGIFSSTRSMVDITKRVGQWTERPLGPPEDAARITALLKKIAALQKQRDAMGSGAKVKPRLESNAVFLVIEAEDFARGNVRVDADQLGKGIGVIRTRLEYPDHIEYEFDVAAAGEYQLELRYAAKDSRPIELSLNGNLEDMNAAAEVTGDWKPANQRWFVQGRYKFKAGKNTLAFHRDGPVPLFDKILIGKVSDQAHSKNVPAKPAAKQNNDSTVVNAEKKKLDAEIAAAQSELETIPTVMAPFDGPVANAPILVRGNPGTPGEIVPRGFPRIIPAVAEVKQPGPQQSGRLELALWLTQPGHPLTVRVIVNRVWQWHFGEGLVRSVDNFGIRGEKPSHPELLDWLAAWFVENGWSLKKLHTLICTSAAYRRTNFPTRSESGLENPLYKDPENRLLSRFPRRRLSAEELRDSMLSVSGKLDRTLGGSVMTVMNRTYAAGGNAPGDIVKQMHYDTPRRSLYLPIIRSAVHDFLAAFDYPDPGMLTGQREQTTVAPQALFLMNSPFVKEQAAALAERVLKAGADDVSRVRAAYQLTFGRAATDAEVKRGVEFVVSEPAANPSDAGRTAFTRLCHSLLISNEFLYLR